MKQLHLEHINYYIMKQIDDYNFEVFEYNLCKYIESQIDLELGGYFREIFNIVPAFLAVSIEKSLEKLL